MQYSVKLHFNRKILIMEKDKEFVEYVLKSLVENPSAIVVNRTIDERGVLLSVDGISKDDMKRVIGREGRTVNAIRTLLRVIGMKNDSRVNLKINEPEGESHESSVSASSVDQAMEELKGI